jgi:cytochrome c peroxidase
MTMNMFRHLSLGLLVAALLLLTSCERAQRYPAVVKVPVTPKDDAGATPLYRLSWIEPSERRDLPIEFVSEADPLWQHLPAFWTHYPPMPTYFAQPPLQAIVALALTDHHQAIKIKVPRGLPKPTFPASNPPSYGKWRLGKALFHERSLPAGSDPYSCAMCHKPEQGFADGRSRSDGGKYNTLSLINVAYNRRQFWDGRVETLEETLVRGLDDERNVDSEKSRDRALGQHNFGGFVGALVATKKYNDEFDLVFGVEHPNQNTVAEALATYMRTILSGDSLYDRAVQVRQDKNSDKLLAAHFLEALKDDSVAARMQDDPEQKIDREKVSAMVAEGYALFNGTGRCAKCHTGPLFSDQDYHNVGYAGKEGAPDIGTETGRAVHVPVGLKESRLLGAFRTPTLRNLAKSAPYFHDGSQFTLADVVDFYGDGVLPSLRLAKVLKDGERPQRLQLSLHDKEALVLFLRALEGTPVDPIVSGLTK